MNFNLEDTNYYQDCLALEESNKLDRFGYDIDGFAEDGYDYEGLDKWGFDRAGYDANGFSKLGKHASEDYSRPEYYRY